jgi:hypothetical protein
VRCKSRGNGANVVRSTLLQDQFRLHWRCRVQRLLGRPVWTVTAHLWSTFVHLAAARNWLMSAIGTKQTSISTLNMSAFGGKADVSDRLTDVR